MAQYHVKRPIMVDGERLDAGSTVDLAAKLAGPLEEIGAVVPKAPESEPEAGKPKRGGKRD